MPTDPHTAGQPADADTDHDLRSVVVVVCTYRRPAVLSRLIDRLVDVAAAAGGQCVLGVVVVDDDPDGSAREVAAAADGRFDLGLRYIRCGSGNISTARNTAVAAGLDAGSVVAMTDDDCMPDESWLLELLAVLDSTDADAVCGACIDVAPPGAPRWLGDQPFLDDLSDGIDRAPTTRGHVKNLMVTAEFLGRHDISFDERLGRIGGEDAKYLHDLDIAGADRRFAAAAVVREQLPPERATLRYQLRRRFWFGNTEAVTMLSSGQAGRPRVLAGGCKLIAVAALRAVRRLVERRPPQLRYTLAELLRGVGRCLGALGFRLEHR